MALVGASKLAELPEVELQEVESPYSSKSVSREERLLDEGEEASSASVNKSLFPIRNEAKWGDTSSYGTKKASFFC